MAGKCKWFSYKRMHPMAQNSRQKSAHLTGFYLLGGWGSAPPPVKNVLIPLHLETPLLPQ